MLAFRGVLPPPTLWRGETRFTEPPWRAFQFFPEDIFKVDFSQELSPELP